MPEIGEAPEIIPLMRENPTPNALRTLTKVFREYPNYAPKIPEVKQIFENMPETMKRYAARLKNKYPDLPEEHIESLLDVTFGAMRSPDKNQFESNEDQLNAIETSARIQHAYVDMILWASGVQAEPEFTQSLYDRVAFMDVLSDSSLGAKNGMRKFWTGIKAEVAVVRALQELGYSVRLPDYTQSDFDENGELVSIYDKEVYQWDIKNGIDMVASKNDVTLFVDSKSQRIMPNGGERVSTDIFWKSPKKVPLSLREEFGKEIAEGKVKQMTIVLPSSKYYLSGLPKQISSPRSALLQFGRTAFVSDIKRQTDIIEEKNRKIDIVI